MPSRAQHIAAAWAVAFTCVGLAYVLSWCALQASAPVVTPAMAGGALASIVLSWASGSRVAGSFVSCSAWSAGLAGLSMAFLVLIGSASVAAGVQEVTISHASVALGHGGVAIPEDVWSGVALTLFWVVRFVIPASILG